MKKISVLVLFIIMTLCCLMAPFVMAETSNTTDSSIPDFLVWNDDLSEYYNGEDFIWNSERMTYEPRMDNKVLPSPEEIQNIYDWKAENAESTDYITEALMEYQTVYEAYMRDHPELCMKSCIVICDEAMQILTNLGVSALKDMYIKILNDDYMQGALMYAVMEITGIDDLNPSSDEAGKEIWINSFENIVLEASANGVTTIHTNDSEKYGIFADPAIYEISSNEAITSSDSDIAALQEFIEFIKSRQNN